MIPNRRSAIPAALLVVFAVFSARPADMPAAIARKALDLLLAEKYTDLRGMLSATAKDHLSMDFLQDRVGAELRTFGELHGIGEPVIAEDGDNTLVSFPAHFAKTPISIQFTLNPSLEIAGVYLRPPDAPLPKVWARPSYSKPDTFTAREVTIGTDEWKLGGTLVLPRGKGPFPGVVLVPGPGPNNRDEEIYSNRTFRDLAEGLASQGIAVLRYDKRTLTYGDKMSGIAFTIEQEIVEDALRAIAVLRKQPEVAPSRIYVLGHSLGGYIAPRIAAKDGKLAGLIFFAANARPIEDVALDQNDYIAHIDGNPTAQVQQRLDSLKAEVAKAKALEPGKPAPDIVMGLPGVYMLDLKSYDPIAEAKKIRIPMLFLQGGRDFQVTSKDFDAWKAGLAGRGNVEFQQYPQLSHLFISGEGKPSPSDYMRQGNVDPAVISDISRWVVQKK